MLDRQFGLATDKYQLTMAQGYFKAGMADIPATFEMFYRRPPFKGEFVISCGAKRLHELIEHLNKNHWLTFAGREYLESQGFTDHLFLNYLSCMSVPTKDNTRNFEIRCLPDGTAVLPHEPMVQVTGSLAQCQLLETLILNTFNHQSLIATKGFNLAKVAGNRPVIDFGMRRAHGESALWGSYAACVGGCGGTSNVEAGMRFGLPIIGTMAHSWIMSFSTELESFMTYAKAYPNDCVLLVDTYDVRKGVINAIKTAEMLMDSGYKMKGIRIDSGNLKENALMARHMLDEAGFDNVQIILSNDLDEYDINELCLHNVPVNAFGVGTKLMTAFEEPALGGVYKLVDINGQPKMKIAGPKSTLPGKHEIYRNGKEAMDIISMSGVDAWDIETYGQSLLVPLEDAAKDEVDVSQYSEERWGCPIKIISGNVQKTIYKLGGDPSVFNT